MRRPNERHLLQCSITDDEQAIIEQMKRAGGWGSDANLIRSALWALADHLRLEMPNGVFDQHTGSGTWKRPSKKAS